MVPQRWLPILQRVTDGAVAHLELPALLDDLLDRVRDAMLADNAAILLLDAPGRELTLHAVRGPEEPARGVARIPMGRGVAGGIAASGRPRIIDDLSGVEVENPVLRETAHSLVGVPLFVDDRVIGVLHVDSARPRRFTEDDVHLLELLASRIALAVEHARLYEAERAARREAEEARRGAEAAAARLRGLQAVGDAALEYAELNPLLASLLWRIQVLLGVDNVAILLMEPGTETLALYSVRGPESAVLGQVRMAVGEGVAGTIAATRRPLVIENLKAVRVANPFLQEHFRSLLGVPLLAGDHLVGVLHVDTIGPHTFTEADTQLLQAAAERVAAAVVRAQQFEAARTGRSLAEARTSELQEATDRMDEFLGIAAHELRTPLSGLSLNLQLAERRLDPDRRSAGEPDGNVDARAVAAVRPLLSRSRLSVRRLERLVGDLLDASRAREGHVPLRLERVDLSELLRAAAEEQLQTAPAHPVRVAFEVSDPIVVEADPDRIGQVVANFLGNAARYSPPNSPITVALCAEDNLARVAVRDEGPGVPVAERSHIWERFYRVPGVSHTQGSQIGLGLGLYISRDIVERHGGVVGVEDAPDTPHGAEFWFTLPLPRDGDEQVGSIDAAYQ